MLNKIGKPLLIFIDYTDSLLMLGISFFLAEIKDLLGILAMSVTITYTLWKWINEYKEKNDNK